MRRVRAYLRAIVDGWFLTTWPQDEPDTTTPEVIARWVGEHRHPEGG